MTTRETTALLTAQDTMIPLIEAEIVEHTGSEIPFGFNEQVFLINGRVWHQFTVLDDTKLVMFAYLDDAGRLHTVNEYEEMGSFEF